MRFIPTRLHGAADYIVGIVVVGLPFYYGWTGPQRAVVAALGVFVILYSLFTDYEAGLVRYLRVRFHLLLDIIFGLAMLSLPWLFNLPGKTSMPFYAIGILALFLAAATEVRPLGTYSHGKVEERA